MIGVLSLLGVGAERALALSLLLGFTLLVNGLIGALPLVYSWQRFVPIGRRDMATAQAGEVA